MVYNFRRGDRDQPFLLPPDLRDWLPADHLAWFVRDVVDQLDLAPFLRGYRTEGHGHPAYHPETLLGVLLYAYAISVRSSRQIERRCREDIAFRVLAGNQLPDHVTIARFRVRHQQAAWAEPSSVGVCTKGWPRRPGTLVGVTMQRLLVGLVLALAVAGCQADRSGERLTAPVPGRSTTTVGQQAPQPVGVASACTATATTALLKGFFAAFSAGRVRDLDAFFAPASRFMWYANGVWPALRLHSSARDRGSLLGYLQRRQAKHERIRVDAVDFNGYRAADRTAHFGMLLRRTADDIPGGPQLLGGKGAVDCDSQRLMVVAIGSRP